MPDGFQVLEVVGDAASYKTSCLIRIAAYCAAPVARGGLESRVVFVDLDRKLSVERLAQTVGADARDRVVVLRPSGAVDLMRALEAESRATRLIVIDSMLSLFWYNALTEPLGAGYSLQVPQFLFRLAKERGIALAVSRPARGDCVAKTWLSGVTHRLRVVASGPDCRVCKVDATQGEVVLARGALADIAGASRA